MAASDRERRSRVRAPRVLPVWTPTHWLGWFSVLLWAALRPRSSLLLENLALRQQLGVLRRAVTRPHLTDRDRIFWLILRRLHAGWANLLAVASPETVLRWHRQGWRAFWGWRSRHVRLGRPEIGWKLMHLIRRLSKENPLWGYRRLHAELLLLGHTVGEQTVRRYMLRRGDPQRGQGWKTFLRNTLGTTAACDFFVVPTLGFQRLFAFVILDHGRRVIRHVAVTAKPSVAWCAVQLRVAFPKDRPRPKHLVHDREKTFRLPGFLSVLADLGIEDKVSPAPRQPWMNGLCERVIGTLRRDCTDHVLVFNEAHLERILRSYVVYYNASRTHLALERNAPIPRAPTSTPIHDLDATPVLGGLHHTYRRAA